MAGAIALLLPLLILLMMAIIEISDYFVLKQLVAYVARQAAHEIAYGYGTLGYTTMNTNGASSGPANTSDPNYTTIVNSIAVPGVIKKNSSAQFKTYFHIPNSPSLSQSYVTVYVNYKSGPGLPDFPWVPLRIGGATFDAASTTVGSSCSWPIAH
jgi:Flp pilus assembly protein TadG